jgi:dTDP-4-dehydrorhamnose reductase
VKRILLIGKTGQVGHELLRSLAPLGTLIAPDHAQMDLTDADSIRRVTREARPDVIVNAAGFTLVDQAESQPDLAMQLNGIAPGILAETSREIGALLFHYSTTFVYDGTKSSPYVEEDIPVPVNVYGKSKLAGEQAIISCGGDYIIVRANWTYSDRRTNFPLTILALAKTKTQLRVVDDQNGSPTWARAYAEASAALVREEKKARANCGIYHLSAAGHATRYEFARKIIEISREIAGKQRNWPEVVPISSDDYPTAAKRPLNTVTDKTKIKQIFDIEMAPWQEQLAAFLHDVRDLI